VAASVQPALSEYPTSAFVVGLAILPAAAF
jgi:hypothetical protein